MTVEVEAKPEITKAAARGDLASVRRIAESAAATSRDDKIKAVNRARKWREVSPAYRSEDNPAGAVEWHDVTPLTTAAMRGHDQVVEYLLRQGADPTLKGCPRDDIELSDDGEPLVDLPGMHMNAFDAANKLSRKIRCCRRTQDLLSVIKPYWKKSVYSGSSAMRHKRTVFSNLPLGPNSQNREGCQLGWILDALEGIPDLEDYPLRPKDFNKSMADNCYWKKRKRDDKHKDDANNNTKDGLPPQNVEAATDASKGRDAG